MLMQLEGLKAKRKYKENYAVFSKQSKYLQVPYKLQVGT